jgi:hypothetical protein
VVAVRWCSASIVPTPPSSRRAKREITCASASGAALNTAAIAATTPANFAVLFPTGFDPLLIPSPSLMVTVRPCFAGPQRSVVSSALTLIGSQSWLPSATRSSGRRRIQSFVSDRHRNLRARRSSDARVRALPGRANSTRFQSFSGSPARSSRSRSLTADRPACIPSAHRTPPMRRHLPLAALSLVAACAGRYAPPRAALARRRAPRDGRRAGRQRPPPHRRRASPRPRRRAAHGGRLQRLPVPLLRSRPPRRERPPRALPPLGARGLAQPPAAPSPDGAPGRRGRDGGARPGRRRGLLALPRPALRPSVRALAGEPAARRPRRGRRPAALRERARRGHPPRRRRRRRRARRAPGHRRHARLRAQREPRRGAPALRGVRVRRAPHPRPRRPHARPVAGLRRHGAPPGRAPRARRASPAPPSTPGRGCTSSRPPTAPTRGRPRPRWCSRSSATSSAPTAPGCGPTLDALRAHYGDRLRIVWRDLPAAPPRPRPPAAEAAREVLAQRGPDGFWRMHDLLFAAQSARRPWAPRSSSASPSRRAPTAPGCAPPSRTTGTARSSTPTSPPPPRRGCGLGTPAFFINGHFMSGARPLSEFRQRIDGLLGAPVTTLHRGGPLALARSPPAGCRAPRGPSRCAGVVHRGRRSGPGAAAGGVPRAERHGAGVRPRRGRSRGGRLDLRRLPPGGDPAPSHRGHDQPLLRGHRRAAPDAVVGVEGPTDLTALRRLRSLGIRVVVPRVESIAEVLSGIDLLGSLLHRAPEAAALRARIARELDAVRSRVAGRPEAAHPRRARSPPARRRGPGIVDRRGRSRSPAAPTSSRRAVATRRSRASLSRRCAPDAILDLTATPRARRYATSSRASTSRRCARGGCPASATRCSCGLGRGWRSRPGRSRPRRRGCERVDERWVHRP